MSKKFLTFAMLICLMLGSVSMYVWAEDTTASTNTTGTTSTTNAASTTTTANTTSTTTTTTNTNTAGTTNAASATNTTNATGTANTVSQQTVNDQLLMGVLWMQKSGEFEALCFQAYNAARMMYDLELTKKHDQKLAVIVDIDETIFNNMPLEAALIGTDLTYSKLWTEWCKAARAQALPGAVEFLNYVVVKGGDVYYITNRSADVKEYTMANLENAGFPQVKEHLMVMEKPEQASKESRRQIVMKDHEVVILMGDNLNDFCDLFYGASLESRLLLAKALKDEFGHRFIILPNPVYGDWETAIYGGTYPPVPQMDKLRRDNLVRFSPTTNK